MHTKKTNNTNKLPFCPYKNLKTTKLKTKDFSLYQLVRPVSAKIRLVFKPVRNVGSFGTRAHTGTVWYPLPCPSPPIPQKLYIYKVTITSNVRSGKSESVNGIN